MALVGAAAPPLLLTPPLALRGALQVVYSCCLPGVPASVLAQQLRCALLLPLVRSVSPLALEEVLPVRSGLGSFAAALRALQQPEGSLKRLPPQLLQEFLQYLEQLLEYLPPFIWVSTK